MHCPRRAGVRQKDPLHPLTNSERRALEQLARSHSAPALSVARARGLLGVSDGCSYTEAAQLVGRSVGDSIAKWVARFNQVGLAAVERQAGGRPPRPTASPAGVPSWASVAGPVSARLSRVAQCSPTCPATTRGALSPPSRRVPSSSPT